MCSYIYIIYTFAYIYAIYNKKVLSQKQNVPTISVDKCLYRTLSLYHVLCCTGHKNFCTPPTPLPDLFLFSLQLNINVILKNYKNHREIFVIL